MFRMEYATRLREVPEPVAEMVTEIPAHPRIPAVMAEQQVVWHVSAYKRPNLRIRHKDVHAAILFVTCRIVKFGIQRVELVTIARGGRQCHLPHLALHIHDA